MHLMDKWKTRRYLRRIILLITTSIFMVLAVFSTIIYLNVDKAVMDNEDKVNRRILLQVKHSIDQTQDMIDAMCISVYLNPDAISMMYDNSSDYAETAAKMNKLRTTYMDVNPYVQSISILNKYTKEYFTSDNGLFYKDDSLTKFIKSQSGQLPKIRPVLREVDDLPPGYTEPIKSTMFSYFMYDSLNSENMPDGAVIVNVKSDWLLDSIKAINTMDRQTDDGLFLIDSNAQFIGVGNNDSSLQEVIKAEYLKHEIDNSTDTVSSFQMEVNSKSYLISYVTSQKAGWVILKSQPINEVYDYVNKLKTSIILITCIFLSVTILLSFTVSSGIYKPIQKLMNEITESDSSSKLLPLGTDEITYIKSVLSRSTQQLTRFQTERSTNQSIMKTYFLRKILVDSAAIGQEEFAKAKEEHGLAIQYDQPIVVFVLKTFDYRRLDGEQSPIETEQIRIIILNAISEILSGKYAMEAVDLKEDHIVLLINAENSRSADLLRQMREAQQIAAANNNIIYSVTASDAAPTLREVAQQYNIALSNSMYAYIFGHQAFIEPAMVASNNACRFYSFSTTLERKLSEEIKGGNLDSAEDVLWKILEEIQGLNYKNMMLSVMHLVNIISDTAEDISRTRIEPVFTDYNAFQSILDACTIRDLHDECMNIFKKIMSRSPDMEKEKHNILADAVKEIVGANFTDVSLCLQQIAEILKMSPGYVGKIFKTSTGLSVAEYINEIRLAKAAELLQGTAASIGDITKKIGMENESYFYKLFKKKYGSTPKEYVHKWAISPK
jgi:YesN/AraC family two-component response regulator